MARGQAAIFPYNGACIKQLEGIVEMALAQRHKTVQVPVGNVKVGGGAPVVVQSMTNTDTADIQSTTKQIIELANAGSELVRITVNLPPAAAAVAEIKKRCLD